MKKKGLLNYVFNMPYDMIIADVKEFVRLHKEYNRVNLETKRLYNSLMNNMRQFSCANYVEPGCDNAGSAKELSFCKNFFHKTCEHTGCTCMKEHNEYWKLMEKRKHLMTAKAEFWDAKFQNVR